MTNKGMTFQENYLVHLACTQSKKSMLSFIAKGAEFWKMSQCQRERYLTEVSVLPRISPGPTRAHWTIIGIIFHK